VEVAREASVLLLDLTIDGIKPPISYEELIRSQRPELISGGVIRPWNLLITDSVSAFAAHEGLYESILQSPARPRLVLLLVGPLFSPTSTPTLSLPLVFQEHRLQVRVVAVTDCAGCEWAAGDPLPSGIAYWPKDPDGSATLQVLSEPLSNESVFNEFFASTSAGGYDAWSLGTRQVWFGRLPQKATAGSLYEAGQGLVGDDGDAALLAKSADWEIPPALSGEATEDDLLTLSEGSILEAYQQIRRATNSEKLMFGVTGRRNTLKRVAAFPTHHIRVLQQLEEKSNDTDATVSSLLHSIDATDGFNEEENRKFERLGIVIKRSDDYRKVYRDVATQLNDRIVDGVRDWIHTGHSIAPLVLTVEDTIEKVNPLQPSAIIEKFSDCSLLRSIEKMINARKSAPKGPILRMGQYIAKVLQPAWSRLLLAILYTWLLATGVFEAFDQGRTPGFLPVPESVRGVAADVVVAMAIIVTISVILFGAVLMFADSKIRAWGKSAGLLELEKAVQRQQEYLERVILNEWVLSRTRRRTANSLRLLNETLRGLSEVVRTRLIDRHAELAKITEDVQSPNPAVRKDLNDVAAAGTFMQLEQVIAILRADISTIIDEVLSLRIHEFKGVGGEEVPAEINHSIAQKIDRYIDHLREEGPLSLNVALSRESVQLRKHLIETYWKNVSVVSSAVQDSALLPEGAKLVQFINSEDLLHLDQQSKSVVVVRFAPEPSREEIQAQAANLDMNIIYTETTSCAGILRATGFRNPLVEQN